MLKNFFTITFRSFIRNWNYTLINSLGLSVGIASCLIIFLIINFELGFDKFHSNNEHIYRVVHDLENASGVGHSSVTPYPFANAFRSDFPDIPLVTQIHYDDQAQVTFGAEKIKVSEIIFADSLFFSVFDFEVVEGNPRAELGQPGKVFLTESLAKKIMKPGSHGKITLNNKLDLEVVGIIKDPPANSHLTFSMIVSMPSLTKEYLGLPMDEWGMNRSGYCYIVLPPSMKSAAVEERFKSFVEKYYKKDESGEETYHLNPLSEIHFSEAYESNPADTPGASKTNLIILGLLGGFILVVACINFINLSTALAIKKSREVGVRKTLGASRRELTRQFLLEALMLTLVSTVIALVIVELTIQPIGTFLGKEIIFSIGNNFTVIFFLLGIVIFTTITSGSYPAFVLSHFNPVTVLKNKISNLGTSGAVTRKYLVTFQFLITQVLIMGTLIVANQMEYFRSKPLGFNKEAIVNISLPETSKERRELFNSLLQTTAGVEHVSFSLGAPTSENNFSTGFYLTERGNQERFDTKIKPVDRNYIQTYGIELVAGRWFTESEEKAMELPKEERFYSYVVNEALVRKLGFASNEDIIGKKITTGLNDINAPVIGVVKNFHTESLHQEVAPAVLLPYPYFYYDAGISMQGGNLSQTMKLVEKAYAKAYPEYIFEYSFLEEHLGNMYREEERSFTLMKIFAGLSIFISCLGLFGLVSFLTQQKIREVGIRKVFGASVQNIVYLFSKGFVGLIMLSFLIAAPLAWFVMNRWLEGFAYHTVIGVSVFIVAISSTTLIALLTVSYQSIRAAIANPIDSLRSE